MCSTVPLYAYVRGGRGTPVARRPARRSSLLLMLRMARAVRAGVGVLWELQQPGVGLRVWRASFASAADFSPKEGGLQRAKDAGMYTAMPQECIRNFAIVAHVDHGKSTLSDRLLELTGCIPKGGRARYLDRLPVERARGITVKVRHARLANSSWLNVRASLGRLCLPAVARTPAAADRYAWARCEREKVLAMLALTPLFSFS